MMNRRLFSDRLTIHGLTLAAALAVLGAGLGVFSTWATTGTGTLNGVQGPDNGWLVVIFALIALGAVRAMARGSLLGIATVLGCAAVMLWAALDNLVDNGNVLNAGSGWGLWLTVGAALVLAVAALSAAARRGAQAPADRT